MSIFFAILLCSISGYAIGYLHSNHWWASRMEDEVLTFNDILEHNSAEFKNNLRETRNVYELKIRELKNENAKLLNEISVVTGIDEVNLPSFGTIYLNSDKHLREAMKLLYKEDEDNVKTIDI